MVARARSSAERILGAPCELGFELAAHEVGGARPPPPLTLGALVANVLLAMHRAAAAPA